MRISGASAQRAQDLARSLTRDGVQALLSFGLAGGLSPDLKPGDLLINGCVHLPEGGEIAADAGLIETLKSLLPSTRMCPAAGVDAPALNPADKAKLASQGAGCVDMETHGVALAAREAHMPWAAVRAIADDADTALPGWAMGLVRPDGSVDDLRAALALLRKPWDLPLALRLAAANAKALRALASAAQGLRGLPHSA